MLSYKKQLVFLIIGFIFFITFFFYIYSEVQKKAVFDLNNRQILYARLAAEGIEQAFDHHFKLLQYLAQNENVITLNAQGRERLRTLQQLFPDEIRGITRVNAQGKIIYSIPFVEKVIGSDISGQEHVKLVMQSKNPVVSDVFTSKQGFKTVAFHMPVFRGTTFDGSIAFLISFDGLAKKYLDNIKIEDSGYAWMITEKGMVIYSPFPGDIGNSILDNARDFPEILEMARKMMKGEKGIATYTGRRTDTEGRLKTNKKHAAYMPVRIFNTFWSIVVTTPEEAVWAGMTRFRVQFAVVMLFLFVIFAAAAYTIARIRSEAEQQQKKRQMEEKLLQSARETQDLYNNAPCGYHSLDADGRIVRINETELSWLGYTREDLIGKPCLKILSNESRLRFTDAFSHIKEHGEIREVEYDLLRADGSTFPVMVSASAITDVEGNFVMTRSTVLDITEHRRQQERLRESENLYRTALENTNDGIVISQDRKYVYVNRKLMETIGRPDETLVGQPVGALIHPDDRYILRDNYEARMNGQPLPYPNYDMRFIKPDQSVAYANVSIVEIIYQGKPAVLAFIRDITRQKQMENSLRESEALYRTALESTSDGVSILQNGRYTYINQKFLETMGVPAENPVGKPLGMLVHSEDREMLKESYLKRLRGEPTSGEHELRVIRPDGSLMYINVISVDIVYQGQPAVLSFIRDISQKKKTEQALRESEELYRTALEATSDGVTITQNGIYVYVNQRMLNTIGRPDENLIGKPQGHFVNPEDWARVEEAYRRRQKGDPLYSNYELRVIRPDQSVIYLHINTVKITYHGKPAILTFSLDITKRKEAEDALRESEELYRTAIEKTNDGISIIQDSKYVYANQKLLKTIGREEGIVGLPLGIYIHPEDRKVAQNYYEARRRGEPTPLSYDIRVIKPDGTVITINISGVNITYRGKPAVIAFVLDITERRKAEEALRQSEEKYRTIIESIDDDYFETDLKGNITFLNKTAEWSGHNRDEIIGMNYRAFVAPDMAAKINAAFNQIYRDGKSARVMDYQVIRKDGSICHLEMSVSLIRDAEGKPQGFRGISRDVSERYHMEEERKKLTEQLHQAQKMEAIGTLAGGIAHDFNNLLMGIQGYTSIMLLEVDAAHPYYDQLKAIQMLVQSGSSLTKQMLGFARAGRYEVVVTDINDLVSKSVGLFGRTKKEISIYEKYADNLQNVEVDRGQIDQVLLNLFVNAWQAMPGGGSLYVETENVVFDKASADLYDLKPGHYIKIAITDTGVGMDEKTRQRIFDPFFTTKEMGRGTGLGLASAYGIIKGHGGMITVYSEKGQGTTFHIYLPATSKKATADVVQESELKGGREIILLVDDEEIITEVTSRLLTELGYTIVTAGSGEKAIEIYTQKQGEIDLVILDMIMPNLSGGETFDRLKAIDPNIRAILSSGYSIDGKAQAIMKRGVRVFLQKPYRLNDLAQKIREALAD